MTCTICQSPKSTVAYYGQIRGGDVESILQCSDCGVRYLKNMREYDYTDGYRETVGKDDISRHIFGMLSVASLNQAFAGKTTMDIGCSNGLWLDVVSRYTTSAYGVEPNNEQRKSSGHKVYASLTDAILEHKGEIDTLTLWHVIEHIMNPVEFLIEASQLLSKTGKIYISTPNTNCISMKMLDTDYAKFFYRAWHTHYYDVESLGYLASYAGLNPLIFTNRHSFGIGNTFGWLRDKKPCGDGIQVEPNQDEQIDHYFKAWVEHIGLADTMYGVLEKQETH